MKLWPDQYVNKKCQEHEDKIVALQADIAALKKIVADKPKRATKKKAAPKD